MYYAYVQDISAIYADWFVMEWSIFITSHVLFAPCGVGFRELETRRRRWRDLGLSGKSAKVYLFYLL
jgi:hypothetical protein